MDSNGGKIPAQFHPLHYHHHCSRRGHHHHVFYISPNCPLHRSISQPENHSPSCSFPSSVQNPEPFAPAQLGPDFSFPVNQSILTPDDAILTQDEVVNFDDEEEADPVFVLTDEWRDFFAKSEAKRRLAKKKAKKGKN